jgi:hypothetical protein
MPWLRPSTPTARRLGYEFTSGWASNNIPFVTPLLRDFVGQARTTRAIRYLEIGAYEGRNLAFMDWLIPGPPGRDGDRPLVR